MSGSGERVVPLLVGVIAFIIVLSFIVSNLGAIGGEGPVPSGGLSIYGEYDYWEPDNVTITSDRTVDYYPVPDWEDYEYNFTKAGEMTIYFYVVRNNTDYIGPDGELWQLYTDFIIFDQHGGFLNLDIRRYAVSYDYLVAQAVSLDATQVEVQFNLWNQDYALFIHTDGEDSDDFSENLMADDYSATLAFYTPPAGPETTTNVLQMIWWVLTLNTAWLPTYPLVVYIVGVLVDSLIILCVVRLLWGG